MNLVDMKAKSSITDGWITCKFILDKKMNISAIFVVTYYGTFHSHD